MRTPELDILNCSLSRILFVLLRLAAEVSQPIASAEVTVLLSDGEMSIRIYLFLCPDLRY